MNTRKVLLAGAALCLSLMLIGCGTVEHSLSFNSDFKPQSDTRIEVGEVSNQTGESVDIDIEKMLADALTEELRRKNLLWAGQASTHLVIKAQLVDYEKGNAFKRWLLPGWGSTELEIHCQVVEGENVVGSGKARRTVAIGGGYTIGAWRSIFKDVAKDLVADLRKQIPK